MTLQIKSIILYGKTGQIRELNFQLGRVNIITGGSGTGKTTLISIIEYCMGRASFEVKLSPQLQQYVAWYAVLYQVDENTQLFVAKPPPIRSMGSRSDLYYEIAENIAIPPLESLILNSNDQAVEGELSRRLGIAYRVIPEENQVQNSYDVDVDQVRFYLFQDQDIISASKPLFYRAGDPYISQTIKNTLPYFLGAVPESYVALMTSKKELSRELNKAARELNELEEANTHKFQRALMLLDEAKQAGLISEDTQPNDEEQIRKILEAIRGWTPEQPIQIPNDRLSLLQQQASALYIELSEVQHLISSYNAFVREANQYAYEAREQSTRLEAINFFKDNGSDLCPMCGRSLDEHLPSTQSIHNAIASIQADLGNIRYQRPELQIQIQEQIDRSNSIKSEIQQLEQSIRSILAAQKDVSINNSVELIRYVMGRVSYYLDITPRGDTRIKELRSQINNLDERLLEIKLALDSTQIEDILEDIRISIGNDIAQMADRLNVEHKGHPAWLDFKLLTVKTAVQGEILRLDKNIGSAGRNHINYHLAALLALHRFFINNNRPVPGFIVFDQPSLPYFPEERYQNDEDKEKVREIIQLLFDVCADLYPNLQIIVLEHANFSEEWDEFASALVDRPWRDGHALIPQDWLES